MLCLYATETDLSKKCNLCDLPAPGRLSVCLLCDVMTSSQIWRMDDLCVEISNKGEKQMFTLSVVH